MQTVGIRLTVIGSRLCTSAYLQINQSVAKEVRTLVIGQRFPSFRKFDLISLIAVYVNSSDSAASERTACFRRKLTVWIDSFSSRWSELGVPRQCRRSREHLRRVTANTDDQQRGAADKHPQPAFRLPEPPPVEQLCHGRGRKAGCALALEQGAG